MLGGGYANKFYGLKKMLGGGGVMPKYFINLKNVGGRGYANKLCGLEKMLRRGGGFAKIFC